MGYQRSAGPLQPTELTKLRIEQPLVKNFKGIHNQVALCSQSTLRRSPTEERGETPRAPGSGPKTGSFQIPER